jgi:hypothetical protein
MNCRVIRKVMTEEVWRGQHAEHGEPEKVYPVKQPPTYRIFVLRCSCGAEHVGSEEKS